MKEPPACFCCPTCAQHWHRAGTQIAFAPLGNATRQHASILPLICPLCASPEQPGVLQVDEYGLGQAGYGWWWERKSERPRGIAQATFALLSLDLDLQSLPPITPEAIAAPEVYRAVLTWLSTAEEPATLQPLSREETTRLDLSHPAHLRAHDLRQWRWKGYLWQAQTPLGNTALSAAWVIPEGDALDVQGLWRFWKQIATQALHLKGTQVYG